MPAMNLAVKSMMKWHSEVDDYVQDMRTDSLNLTTFLVGDIAKDAGYLSKVAIATPEELEKVLAEEEGKKQPIIYPYAVENQPLFEKYISNIEFSSSAVIPVILNIYEKVNLSFRPEPVQQAQPSGNNFYFQKQESGTSKFASLFKKSEKPLENVTDITAYSRSINLIDELMQIPVLLRKWKAYHWERVTDSMSFLRGVRKAQINYLSIELVHYHSVIKPMILHAAAEAMRINLMAEKANIKDILRSGQEMEERRSMNPPPFAPPTQPS
jgi:hypothetical protein